MGHREDLLAGARRCLEERGYAHTTARDIVAASGANLASIGYHYGSKEALLNLALVQAFEEWGDELGAVLAGTTGTGAQRAEMMWAKLLEYFARRKALLVASTEAFTQAARSEDLRAHMAAVYERARTGLAAVFQDGTEDVDPELTRAVGSVHLALVAGLGLQWILDSKAAPTGTRVAEALRRIATTLDSTT